MSNIKKRGFFKQDIHFHLFYGKIHQYSRLRNIVQFRRSNHGSHDVLAGVLTYRLRGKVRHEIADYRCRISDIRELGF